MQFTIARNLIDFQQALMKLSKEGSRVALVPTMGALHAGHIALVEEGKKRADAVVLSIFVNPAQFSENEDFDRYPRKLEEDTKMAQAAGVTLLYTPSVEDIYPAGFITSVSVGEMGQVLCGASRPGHFGGVATVVSKLLLRTLPHVALFGEKDYQQLCIVQRVAYDLDIPIEIVGVPTVREKDGLALSSRNVYLTPEERKIAPKLHDVLKSTARFLVEDNVPLPQALNEGAATLTAFGFKVDYMELRQKLTLYPLDKLIKPSRLMAAAWLGKTRLIDNVPIE